MSTESIKTISGLYSSGMIRPSNGDKQFDAIDFNKDGVLSDAEIICKRKQESVTVLFDGARDILTGSVMAGAAGFSAKLAIITSETVAGGIFFLGLSATCLTIAKNSVEDGVNKFQKANQEIKNTYKYSREIKHKFDIKQ